MEDNKKMAETSDKIDAPEITDTSSQKQGDLAPSPFSIDSSQHQPKPKLTKKLLFAIALLVIVFMLGAWALRSQESVCGQDIVQRHNAANLRGGSHDKEIMKIAQEIESIENYKEDPTCVSMVYYYYAYQGYDYEKTKEHLEVLRVLTAEGKHIDGDLVSRDSIETMEAHFENMDPNYKYEGNLDEIVL